MRGGPPRSVAAVLDQARAVAAREAPGTPTPGRSSSAGAACLSPAPEPRGHGGEGSTLSPKERTARKLARLLNAWADAKDDPELDEAIAEARRWGWLP